MTDKYVKKILIITIFPGNESDLQLYITWLQRQTSYKTKHQTNDQQTNNNKKKQKKIKPTIE